MSTQHGFNLIELMIALAIIAILAMISLPSYTQYTRKAHFSEIVQAASVYKAYVLECYHIAGDLSSCNNAQFGIPALATQSDGAINQVAVKSGKITITPNQKNGIKKTDTYILMPSESGQSIRWEISGGAVDNGLVAKR